MAADRVTGDPVEKWADRIRFVSGDGEECDLHGGILGPLPDIFHLPGLPKTAEEAADIAEVVAALNGLRRSLCGLPPLAFSADRIHVATEEEFSAKITLPGRRFEGKSLLGHAYLWRGWPRHEFQAILAHELTHAASYLWLDYRDRPVVTAGGLTLPRILLRRQGLVLIDPSFGTLLPHFHGLNEGATELFAIAVRQSLARDSKTLDAAARRSLAGFLTSPPLIAFADRLVRTAADGDDAGIMPALKTLFLDLFGGTDRFLSQLEARLPGATEVLRRTGARPPELLAAAEALRFDQLAGFIRPYCK